MPVASQPVTIPGISATKNVIIDGVLRFPPTGLKALVIGAGIGGMMAALECWRKGIDVEIIEKATDLSTLGDVVVVGPSAVAVFHNYPTLLARYAKLGHDVELTFASKDGTPTMPSVEWEWNREGASQHSAYPLRINSMLGRNALADMLSAQCKRLGIPITFGVTIDKYEEDITKGVATAISLDGRCFDADVIIAADGIGTKSHALTLGHPVRAVKTKYVVYRTMYPTDRLKGASMAEDIISRLDRPYLTFLRALAGHCVLALTRDFVVINLTTEEDATTATESWSSTVSNEKVLSSLPEPENWSPLLDEIIRHAPEHSMVRWPLVFRDPQPRWTSPHGRVVQLGDAAHSFLPTSGNGATQALEDAASLGECLRLGAKADVGIATKVHELLRYQRVSLIQHTGFVNAQDLHRDANGTEIARKGLPFVMGSWIWGHHPEKYATENFAQARAHLEDGSPFENTNLPIGHKWKDWTMEEEISKQKAGIVTIDELKNNGDWSIS